MKKNLVLFSVLVIGLIGTFFLKEKLVFFTEDNSAISLKQGVVLKKIKFTDYTIEYPNGFSKTNKGISLPEDVPVDSERTNVFLSMLGSIEIQKELPLDSFSKEELTHLENNIQAAVEFEFQNSTKKYQVGPHQSGSESFYMRLTETKSGNIIKDAFYLTKSNLPNPMYDPKKQDLQFGYRKMIEIFNTPNQFFHDKRIFQSLGPISKISISNNRNKDFVIDLNQFSTHPKIFKGLEYDRKKIEALINFFNNFSGIKTYRKNSTDKLENRLSTVNLSAIKNHELQLFRNFRDLSGYFLLYGDLVYELHSKTIFVFLGNAQDYWIKKPFGRGVNKNQNILFTLSQNNLSYDFKIPFADKFNVEFVDSKGRIAKREEFLKLFLLIFGRGGEKGAKVLEQALRVREYYSDQDKDLFDTGSLEIYILDKKLSLVEKGDEYLILDKETKIIFHYPIRSTNQLNKVSIDLKNYIE